MRKAAGIILIILGVVCVVAMVVYLSTSNIYAAALLYVPPILWRIVSGAFLVIGGLFSLRRRYWLACLISAVYGVAFIGIPTTIDYVAYTVGTGMGTTGRIWVGWGIWGWVVLVGTVISAIFIVVRKKEWQEISDSVDGKVSYGG